MAQRNMAQRKSLSEILNGNNNFFNDWGNVKAANEFGPVPPGTYVARIVRGTLDSSKLKGTPSYTLEFEIIEGEFSGRKCWYQIWLTTAAKTQAKRDLDKLGVTDPATQLERPLPEGIICRIKVVVRTEDSGEQFNKVRSFAVERIDAPAADPFAPQHDSDDGDDEATASEGTGGPAT